MKCQGCRDGNPLPFEFTMAFHPILDLRRNTVWGY
ncbi:EAL domain-containing protein, partial [Methylobacterium sp. WL30]